MTDQSSAEPVAWRFPFTKATGEREWVLVPWQPNLPSARPLYDHAQPQAAQLPSEPTKEMRKAAAYYLGSVDISDLWRALVSALPRPDQPQTSSGSEYMKTLLRDAFDGKTVSLKNIALRKAYDFIANLTEPQGVPKREEVARILWERFAPLHHIGWADETHKAEYLLAADAVLSLLPRPHQSGG